ncbi:MAG: hypothetical protein ACFFC3_11145 [Candidatus Odinarchaeota archaeon]
MYLNEKKKIPIQKGTNDCFFEKDGRCFHIDAKRVKCRGYECHFYKPLRPLKRK